MLQPRCGTVGCSVRVIRRRYAAMIAYTTALMVLAVPFLNSIGATETSTISLAGLHISWISVIIVFVWFMSGYFVAVENHENNFTCFLSAAGMPGILLAILAAVK